ncbi:MAG: transcriptional regulator NrdR [Planctomycetota bacterium]
MICPYCQANDDKVIDSRSSDGGRVVRRRRECLSCGKRFTTYERIDQPNRLVIVKRDGRRDPFAPEKIMRSIQAACGKLPIPEDAKESLVSEIEEELSREYDKEVPSTEVGQRVLARLRDVNKVAYIRFAAEHLNIESIDQLRAELEDLERAPTNTRATEPLFGG